MQILSLVMRLACQAVMKKRKHSHTLLARVQCNAFRDGYSGLFAACVPLGSEDLRCLCRQFGFDESLQA